MNEQSIWEDFGDARKLQNNLLSQTEGDINLQVGVINGVMYSKKIVQEVAEEYKGGWIACSERLPEESGYFCISYICSIAVRLSPNTAELEHMFE